MNPNQYPKEVYDLLYTDETGEVVGLDEVQLMKSELSSRTLDLIKLLNSDDLYLAYQCGLIVGAWGVKDGIDYLHSLIHERIDKVAQFEPHRIWGQDNVYDVIAEAFEIAASINGYDLITIRNLFEELLRLYGECYFESRLKIALLNINERELLPSIKQAMQSALAHERYYQASQLLPVLAKYDKDYAVTQIGKFQSLTNKDERIRYNLDEMQQYL